MKRVSALLKWEGSLNEMRSGARPSSVGFCMRPLTKTRMDCSL